MHCDFLECGAGGDALEPLLMQDTVDVGVGVDFQGGEMREVREGQMLRVS